MAMHTAGAPASGGEAMQPAPPIERIADRLAADGGLAGAEIEDARRRHGANHIVEARARPVLEMVRSTAADPMIWFLVGTAVLYAILGQRSEAITLVASIAPLVGMDLYLHRRSQASTRALGGLLADTARVIRGGTTTMIPAADVVVGDLVEVGAGEPFPADGVIVAARGVAVDESALTGESLPIDKRALPAARTGDAAMRALDAAACGYAGTRVLTGTARLRVAAVGGETLYGAIVRLALGVTRARTPLQRAVSALVSGLLVAAVVLCAVLAVARLHQGYGWIDAMVSAASLAVAALPEEFPVVLTVFLGVGVFRLARRRALVNRAVAVENIGRVSCICTDKTGTITLGQLRVTRVIAAPGFDAAHVLAIAAGAARRETGDPLDQAILDAAGAEPVDALATFPFTEDRRRETVVIATPDGAGAIAMTKGAPETVLALCGGVDRTAWAAQVDQRGRDRGQGRGVRVACSSELRRRRA
jgi:P-type Ca2+ transporter type 2C